VLGITVMAIEENEAVFVNVIGDINPAQLGKVMDNFDINLGNGNGNDKDDEAED
jgi:hypothetical protein